MRWFRKYLVYLQFLLIRLIKGHYKLVMTTSDENIRVLKVTTVFDYEIEIFCQETKFQVKYDRKFIPDSRYAVYKLVGVGHGKCPKPLAKALAAAIYIPELFSSQLDNEQTNKYLVDAYLDIILDRVTRAQIQNIDSGDL